MKWSSEEITCYTNDGISRNGDDASFFGRTNEEKSMRFAHWKLHFKSKPPVLCSRPLEMRMLDFQSPRELQWQFHEYELVLTSVLW